MEIEWGLAFVPIPVAGLDNRSINRILRVQEVHVAGGCDRLAEILAEFYDFLVDLAQFVEVRNSTDLFPHDVLVVAYRLHLQVIIELDDLRDLGGRLLLKDCLVEFARRAGGT